MQHLHLPKQIRQICWTFCCKLHTTDVSTDKKREKAKDFRKIFGRVGRVSISFGVTSCTTSGHDQGFVTL